MNELFRPVIDPALDEFPLSLTKPLPTVSGGRSYETGWRYEPNGDIVISILAKGAEKVELQYGHPRRALALERADGGLFTGRIPFDPKLSGQMVLSVCVDGVYALAPELPVAWQGNGNRNVLEMPSVHGALWSIRDNPHGAVANEIVYSKLLRKNVRFAVYTPPGYAKGAGDYPVLYMLHGGGANEQDWFYAGKAAHIFDNLIEAGKIRPFIAVAPNGMVRFPDSGRVVWDDAPEQVLVRELIPYVERGYRARTDKWSRALCGLSMGAYMCSDIGFAHPELFGYMGAFTASMTHLIDYPNYERPFLSLMRELRADPEEFGRRYRVYFRSTTTNEDHFDYFENDDAILARAGVDRLPCCVRRVYDGNTSKWDSWRLGLAEYIQLIF